METTKPRTVSSIGMFDMLKGAGMLAIVLGHTAELYPLQLSNGLSLTAFLVFVYRETLMAAFFIASGYGFRKRSIGKCIHQQLKSLLKPFCYTAVFTTMLHFIIHYKTFHYLPGSLSESIKVAGGFLLGLPHTATYFGQEFFSCGPMWYLLALLMGWIALDVILNIFPERYIPWAVGGCAMLLVTAVVALLTALTWLLLSRSFLRLATSGGSTGKARYREKKARVCSLPTALLGKECRRFVSSPNYMLNCGLGVLLIPAAAFATGITDCVSMAEWTLGPISILLDGLAGLLFVRLFLRLNRHRNALVSFFEAIGRRSLYIFCIHTVELTAIPWYLFAAKYADRPVLGICLQYVLSLGSIWLVCALLQRRRDLVIKLFPARRHTPQVHYTPRH